MMDATDAEMEALAQILDAGAQVIQAQDARIKDLELALTLSQGFAADLVRTYRLVLDCYTEIALVGQRLAQSGNPGEAEALIALLAVQKADFQEGADTMDRWSKLAREQGEAA